MNSEYKRLERCGTYIGTDCNLTGEKAIVLYYKNQPNCMAQFDNLKKFGEFHNSYALGLHEFKLSDFELDEPVEF
jgi:hypothetical protein